MTKKIQVESDLIEVAPDLIQVLNHDLNQAGSTRFGWRATWFKLISYKTNSFYYVLWIASHKLFQGHILRAVLQLVREMIIKNHFPGVLKSPLMSYTPM